jgi:hypothetical protein
MYATARHREYTVNVATKEQQTAASQASMALARKDKEAYVGYLTQAGVAGRRLEEVTGVKFDLDALATGVNMDTLKILASENQPEALKIYEANKGKFGQHEDNAGIMASKIRQVERNPRGCIYYCHPTRWRGVALIGDLEVTQDAGLRRALWNDGWEVYYPKGVDDSDYAVITLRPRWVAGWTGGDRFGFEVKEA